MAEPRKLEDLDPTARAAEEQWAEEQAWPVFEVYLSGPEIEHVPRADERYWKPKVIEVEGQEVTVWVSKTGKPVMLPARARVQVQAVNEEVAKARALSENPQCHKVDSVEKIKKGS
jgi:hypothetical protein